MRQLYLSLTLLCLTTPALAGEKEDLETARRHYQSGAAFFKSGNYDAARIAFEEAYRLSPRPELLFNLATVAQNQKRYGDAVGYLEKYLESRPDAPDRDQTELQIKILKAQMEKAEKEAQEQKDAQQRAANPTPAPVPTPTPAPETGWRSKLPPWPILAVGAAGVGLLVIGFSLGGAAISTAHQVDAGARFDANLHQHGQALNSAAIAFDVIGSLTLAGAGAWAAYHYLHRPAPRRVAISPQGLGLVLAGAF